MFPVNCFFSLCHFLLLVHPRVCGEHLRLVWVCAKRLESSPRVRGECSAVLTTQ
nr:MAG TPA: hypothetical protein [Caudoviricetes sp.]